MSSSTNFMENKIVLNLEDPSIYHDRVLILGEKKFHVVSGILSLWSEYFRGLFGGIFGEANKEEIELKELDPDVFELFLKLVCYNSLVTLKADDIIPLIELSYRFLTPMVLDQCQQFIDKNFKQFDEMKLQLLETASTYGNEGLKRKIIDNLKDADELKKLSLHDVLVIAEKYEVNDLKSFTVSYMKEHLNFDNCPDYLDYCQKFDLPELKANFSKTISKWKFNEVPPKLIIGLTESAFKHDVDWLKRQLRVCIFCLTESRGNCHNRKRNCKPNIAETTFNWFLMDNHAEIFALPTEISQFIIMSTCKSAM